MSDVQVEDLFPDVPDVHERVAEAWDLSGDFPLPKFDLTCPVCGSDEVGLRYWRFFDKRDGGVPHRCDVGAKCCRCSHAFDFGVPIPAKLYRRHARVNKARLYLWRDVRDRLAE